MFVLDKASSISIGSFNKQSLSSVAKYFCEENEDFCMQMGIRKGVLKKSNVVKQELLDKWQNKGSNSLYFKRRVGIYYKDTMIGQHNINEMQDSNTTALFHAHIFHEHYRRKGIASISYPLAIEHFFKSLNLKKILFKTPVQNTGAIKIKQKLGIPQLGKKNFAKDHPVIQGGSDYIAFELSRDYFFKNILKQ